MTPERIAELRGWARREVFAQPYIYFNECLDEIERLRAAIKIHRDQKADDRCWEDDCRLYAATNLLPADNRVGDKEAMLANCKRFIDRRCEGGKWPSYAELEAQNTDLLRVCKKMQGWLSAGGYNEALEEFINPTIEKIEGRESNS